jgi:hypothetical protein
MIRTKEHSDSEKVKRTGCAMNSKYLKTSTMNLPEGSSRRRRRRFASRVIRISRGISLSIDNEETSITSSWSSSRVFKPKESVEWSITNVKSNVRYSAASVPVRGFEVDEEQSKIDCDYFTLKPIFRHLPTCPELTRNLKAATLSSIVLPRESRSKQRVSFSSRKQRLGSFVSSSSQSRWSKELLSIEDDNDALPPYLQILPQMFYRFAGISQYSNSNLLQSKEDFKQLMTCLGMQQFLEDCMTWFPKPKSIKTNLGYITFDMFCDLFSCKFAQTIIETRWQYEPLCSAIQIMEYLDEKKFNRVEFPQFLHLYRGLYGSDISVENVYSEFNKYDLDGIGLLTVVSIFNFCVDEDPQMDQ